MIIEALGSPSMTPAPPILTHKKSTESMVVDDDNISSPADDDSPFKLLPLDNPDNPDNENHLTKKDFNYTMQLMDDKINSLYKLCRYISDQQEKMASSLKKLVSLDELSDNFWNVSYLTYL